VRILTRILLVAPLVLLLLAGLAPACLMVGDFNDDCHVDIADLLVVADRWLSPGGCSEQGLAGHWKLDAESGSSAADSSGMERHGVVLGQAAWNPFGGRIGGAIQFDGIDDYVEISGYKGPTGTSPRTCAAWFKTSKGGEIISWGQYNAAAKRWIIRIQEQGYLRVEVGGGAIVGSTVLNDDTWHHVAVVCDGTTTDNITLYVDGRVDNPGVIASQQVDTAFAADVAIGVCPGANRYFNGLIDDVRIYDRLLSAAEIWALADTQTTDFSCTDLDADDMTTMTDFSKIAGHWNQRQPPVVINEFLARNTSVLSTTVAGDETFPDWIEIFNNTTTTIDLAGWYLTDNANDLTKWRFPDPTMLAAGEYLIVFASGKAQTSDYTFIDDEGFLHTNFNLSGDGEYLALVRPDGTTRVHEYAHFASADGEAGYPPQQPDISYGLYYGQHRYFARPTPGYANVSPFDGFTAKPVFSHKGGCYVGDFELTAGCSTPDAVIRYTTDGTVPTLTNGTTWSGPIRINSLTHVMAVAFAPGLRPSEVVAHTYVFLQPAAAGFNSDLPIVVIDTDGKYISSTNFTEVSAVVIDTGDDGRAAITDTPDFSGWGGIKMRGSSSTQFPKKQYAFEVWDELRQDKEASILGMPAESDWILYAPYSDKSLMRNFLSYKWSNDIGRYAVRCRFVEVYLNANGGNVAESDYVGVYVFMEKIKRDKNRVDIARLDPSHNIAPQVTGGYIIKKDRLDPGDSGFRTSSGQRLAYVEPKEDEITKPQADWLTGYFNDFEAALYGANYRDPVNGYAGYIDVDSWIDSHILVELTKNIDGYRLSAFMFKDRNGKLNMGPVWDYNLSLGNANYLQGWDPHGWYYPLINLNQYPWYPRLFEDDLFKLRYADRWYELRRNLFSTSRLLADVDVTVRLLAESQKRNFARWPVLGRYVWPNWYIAKTWQEEIDWMKAWIADRLRWMDDQIGSQYAAKPPVYSPDTAQAAGPFDLEITSASGTIYYTLDGGDPRSQTGGLSAGALRYTGPIRLERTTRVKARSFGSGKWSALNEALFSVGPVAESLRITELMYHPAGPNEIDGEAGREFAYYRAYVPSRRPQRNRRRGGVCRADQYRRRTGQPEPGSVYRRNRLHLWRRAACPRRIHRSRQE